MGMYTELVLGVDLVRDTPEEVIDILKYMIEGELEDPEPTVPDHPLFKTDRWRIMLRCDSHYFGGCSFSILDSPRYKGDVYKLSIRSNLKNYDSEIELFLNWLAPYIETRGFIGHMRYEAFDDPWLIYYGLYDEDYIYLYELEYVMQEKAVLNDNWLVEHIK